MAAQPNDPLLALQWYIDGSGYDVPRVDLNVRPVWQDYTGRGVTIGIYDSLVERDHPDLAANYDDSFRVDGLIYDSTASAHGTHVAGVIAGVANNIGVTGVAYGAHITSLPIIFSGNVGNMWLLEAMPHAWRFDVVNMSYGGNTAFDPYLGAAGWADFAPGYTTAAEQGRDGLGTVLVTAAGNARGGFTDANLSYFQTDRHSIVMGAVGIGGFVAEYSSEGANLLAAAPSSDGYLDPSVATTDRMGVEGRNDGTNMSAETVDWDYTTRFGGTSAAAPMASGIAALMLEANPGLGWRDVRNIIALSARHTGSAIGAAPAGDEHSAWTVNAARTLNGGGFHFSNDYGFGLIDALAAVRLAESWRGQATSANEATRHAELAGPLPVPNDETPFHMVLPVAAGVVTETVTLFLDLAHNTAREIRVMLISPRGTVSELFDRQGEPPSGGGTTPFRPWTFVSNAFMGEDSGGDWQLVVTDYFGGRSGVVQQVKLDVFGSAATPDSDYVYTNEYAALAGVAHAAVIRDKAGTDTINAAAVTAASIIRLEPGARSVINGRTVRVSATSTIENAIGGDGADRIVGNAVANRLEGWRGGDTLLGQGGDDLLDGGAGADSLLGGAGADTLLGGAGADTLAGGAGFDSLAGGEGGDSLGGQGGDDLLDGGAGADTLAGGVGFDSLAGGEGDDSLDGQGGSDTMAGGAGDDAYRVDNFNDRVLEAAGEGQDTVVSSVGFALPINVETLLLDGPVGMYGWGNDGANRVVGGAGGDSLRGGQGDDTLDGGPGADSLTGGTGADCFVFRIGQADGDRIEDFRGLLAGGHDRLVFEGFGAGAALLPVGGGDWQVTGAAGAALLHFVNGPDIAAADCVFA